MYPSFGAINIKKPHVLLFLALTVAVVVAFGWRVISRWNGSIGQDRMTLEGELILNATLADSLSGRYGFERGKDDLFVISRIRSSVSSTDSPTLKPTHIERLWLQVPANTATYTPIQIQDLEQTGRIGYEAGQYGKPMNSRFCPVEGWMALIDRQQDQALVYLDLKANPPDAPAWPIRQLIIATITQTGLHVQPNAPSDKVQPATAPLSRPILSTSHSNRRLLGRWFGQVKVTRRGIFDVYFQFDDNNRCAHATVRGRKLAKGGYTPGMKYGSYEIVGDWLVFNVETFVFDEPVNVDHMHLLKPVPIIALRIDTHDRDLVLTGDWRQPINRIVDIRFEKKADCPDLREYRPNPDRRSGFYARPEPTTVNPNITHWWR